MQKLTITGNVSRDANVKSDKNGKEFVVFTVAVNCGTRDNPKTNWVDVSCNGRLVDLAMNKIRKGVKVIIDGHPTVKGYLDSNNNPVGSLRLYAHTLELLSPRPDINNENNLAYEVLEDETRVVLPN